MIDYARLQKALQTFFPSDTVSYKVINNIMYVTCDKQFSATLDFSRERKVSVVSVDVHGYKGLYEYEIQEFRDNEKYVINSIISSIIRSRKSILVRTIHSKLNIFKKCIREMYPNYYNSCTRHSIVDIQKLMESESSKFLYFENIGKIGSIQDQISYKVEYYPIWYIGKFTNKFQFIDIIKNFNPYIQNLYQINYVAQNFLSTGDKQIIYMNILSAFDLYSTVIIQIIDDVFDGEMTATLFKHIKSFKRFKSDIADRYRIHELNMWDYIATMDNLSEIYIEKHYSKLRPYFSDIFKNPNLSLDFLKSHRFDIFRTNSYSTILLINKNIDRNYLVKYSKKCKNSIIHRMDLLRSGDEILFKKYRKKIKWDLLVQTYTGREDVSIDKIIEHGGTLISYNDSITLKTIREIYIRHMFVQK